MSEPSPLTAEEERILRAIADGAPFQVAPASPGGQRAITMKNVFATLDAARTALAAAQTDAAHWCEKYDGAIGEREHARDEGDRFMQRIADLTRERDEARLDVRTLQAAPDMNGDAIMEARAYLKEHLGVSTAFFDDCIHNAVALCLQAREARDAAVALAEARRVALETIVRETQDREPPYRAMPRQDMIDVARAALALTDAGALEALRERVRAEALEEAEECANEQGFPIVAVAIRALAGGRKPDTEGK